MPTPTKGPRLGGGPAHERLMLANLATALFEHDRITTTEAKAKRLRPLAEKLITFAESQDHTILELAMSWLASFTRVASVIAGATNPAQVQANATAVADASVIPL